MHVAIQQEPSARAALCKRQRSSWQSYSCRADGQHETSAQDKASIGKFNASLDIQGQACVRGAIPWTVDWPYLSAQERTMDRLAGQSRPRSKRPISSTRRRKARTTSRRHRVPHAMAKMLRCTMIDDSPVCKHGNQHYCGLCKADSAPKCKHGNPFYCGHDGCGVVRSAKDDVMAMIKSGSWKGES